MRRGALFLMVLGALLAPARVLVVGEPIKIHCDTPVVEGVISPDGTCAIVSHPADLSLSCVDLADGSTKRIAESGIMYELKFTPDSKGVRYIRESEDRMGRRFREVRRVDIESGADVSLKAPARALQRIADTLAQTEVWISYGELMISFDGITRSLNPNGKDGKSYLWPSLSPDASRVLYYVGGDGAYTCRIDGSDVRRLGEIRAPRWLDNDLIIGMHDLDDGFEITESTIVAVDIDGNKQTLTSPALMGMYPSASADGSKILFSTPLGDLYLMHVR